MAVTNRDIEKHLAELKQQMDFEGANEMRKLQDEVYQRYMKEMRSNLLYPHQSYSVGFDTGIGDLGLTAAQVMRRRSPPVDVLCEAQGRTIDPSWRGPAVTRVRMSRASPYEDTVAIAFCSGMGDVVAHVYMPWKTPQKELYAKAAFYAELMNQWRVGEVTVTIEI